MPATSPKQYGFMAGVANGNIQGIGAPSQAVAQEFVDKTPSDKRSKFAKALAKKRKVKLGTSSR
jgi:hypothetical protein